jgi:hypothetical protein
MPPQGYGPQGYGPQQGYAPQQGYGQGQPMQQQPPKKKTSWGVTCLIVAACMVPVMGVLAALAIHGVRRYLVSAKSAEAKNTIGAIGRAMVSSYEANGALCGPVVPVPAAVPSGRKYQPSIAAGQDFQQGTATDGWTCLKFSMTQPMYYQYDVRIGGGYKGTARGGPDPGPDGLEISAEGDLDGDGITSLFIRTGKVDAASKRVVLATELTIIDEME